MCGNIVPLYYRGILDVAGKGKPKTGGRQKGSVNKSTALLKDAILLAAERAGDKEGMVGYLTTLAKEHPAAFTTLLGKMLTIQAAMVSPEDDEPIAINIHFSEPPSRSGLTPQPQTNRIGVP